MIFGLIAHSLFGHPIKDSNRDPSRSVEATETYCASLLNHVTPPGFKLPEGCNGFEHIKARLEEKKSLEMDAMVAFAGMSPKEACEARTARQHRQPTQAQLIRRMTTRNRKSGVSAWF